ncbi:hypothetical protein A2U01_0006694 [Trifolium medium]|uniref:Uncharacterized protein n=1 Tax=Trifolium medium TaxID=97028 RepID=A0A392MEB5_9FABA|nr:hypothetical protein [Trifolium medium]
MQSVSGGQFSSIPKAMLDMLAKMTLEEENEDNEQPADTTRPTSDPKEAATSSHQQSPSIAKRKFQIFQGPHQFQPVPAATSQIQTIQASLVDQASQGQ